jgi:hypothetical protein
MPERTIKRRLQDTVTPRSLPTMVRSSRPLPSWSRHSSAPFPRGRKARSRRRVVPWLGRWMRACRRASGRSGAASSDVV